MTQDKDGTAGWGFLEKVSLGKTCITREKRRRFCRQCRGLGWAKAWKQKFPLEDSAKLRRGHWENMVMVCGSELFMWKLGTSEKHAPKEEKGRWYASQGDDMHVHFWAPPPDTHPFLLVFSTVVSSQQLWTEWISSIGPSLINLSPGSPSQILSLLPPNSHCAHPTPQPAGIGERRSWHYNRLYREGNAIIRLGDSGLPVLPGSFSSVLVFLVLLIRRAYLTDLGNDSQIAALQPP